MRPALCSFLKKRPALALLCLLTGPALAAGAAGSAPPAPSQPEASYRNASGAALIGGAEHARALMEAANAAFMQQHPGVRLAFDGKGASSAVPLLMHGRVLLAVMGRAMNDIERVPWRKTVGAEPLAVRVAHAALRPAGGLATHLAVYVHAGNPLPALSVEQLARMLSTGHPLGDFSHWSQLGLTGPQGQQRIAVCATPEYTGFGDWLQKHVLQGRPLTAYAQQRSNSAALLECVAQNAGGVAVAALGMQREGVRAVPLLGLASGQPLQGTAQEVTAQDWPLARPLLVYVRRLPGQAADPLARDYLRFLLSPQGQALVAARSGGYLPLTSEQAQAELRKLDEAAPAAPKGD